MSGGGSMLLGSLLYSIGIVRSTLSTRLCEMIAARTGVFLSPIYAILQ